MLEAVPSLPDEVETLRHIIAGLTGELAAAKAGLVTKSLEIETLKVQIARLRRQQFGRYSEKLDRQIEQLELVLEDLEISAGSDRPESEASAVMAVAALCLRICRAARWFMPGAAPVRPAVGRCARSTRMSPRSSITCRAVSRSSAISVRPCRAGPAKPWCRPRCRACRSSGASRAPACSPMCWSANSVIICRSIANPASTPAMASNSTAPPWPIGSARWQRCSSPWSARWSAMSSLPTSCTPMTPRFRYWRRGPARPGPGGCGSICATSVRTAAANRPPCSTATAPTARASIPATVTEVACWAHVRRKFHDIHLATASPLAAEALERIGGLFGIERQVNGKPPGERRQARQDQARPLLDDLAAVLYTLIETAKLNHCDPEAYLRNVIGRIAYLLPWNLTS